MKKQLERLLLRLGHMISVHRASVHRGATAVEYALILFAIAGIIIGVVQAVGQETMFGWGSVNDNYDAVRPVVLGGPN